MTRARQHLVVLVLLLPLASWLASSGGLPLCCWCRWTCPQTAEPSAGRPSCPMMAAMPAAAIPATCRFRPADLILPAPAAPLFPPRAAGGATAPAATRFASDSAPSARLAGWPAAVFHPPQRIALISASARV